MASIKHTTVADGLPRKLNGADWDSDHVFSLTQGMTLIGGPGNVAIEILPSGIGSDPTKANLSGGNNFVGNQTISAGSSLTVDNIKVHVAGASPLYGNMGIGYQTLFTALGPDVTNTTAIGFQAGKYLTTGGSNTFVGSECGVGNDEAGGITGGGNTALGSAALGGPSEIDSPGVSGGLSTGAYNTAIGNGSLNGVTTGSSNTALGRATGAFLTTGANNILVGVLTGLSLTTGSGNTIICNNYSGSAALTNTLVIGANGRSDIVHNGTTATITGTLTVTGAIAAPNLSGTNTGDTPTFEHNQSVSSATWTVNHNLGRRPAAVQVLSVGYKEVGAEFTHTSVNQVVVQFEQPQTGFVRLV